MMAPDEWRYTGSHPAVRSSIVACLLTAVATVGLVGGFWWPTFNEAHRTIEQIASIRKNIRDTILAQQFLDAFQNAEAVTAKWETRLGAGDPQKGTLTFLPEMGERYRVKILSLVNNRSGHASGLGLLNQEFIATGSYKNLKRFLVGVEALPTLTVLQSISLERSPRDGKAIRANIRLVTFHSGAVK